MSITRRAKLRSQLRSQDRRGWEHARKQARRKKKEDRQKKKLNELRRSTITASVLKKSEQRHTHSFGPEVQVGDTDVWEKTCSECGYKVAVERM